MNEFERQEFLAKADVAFEKMMERMQDPAYFLEALYRSNPRLAEVIGPAQNGSGVQPSSGGG